MIPVTWIDKALGDLTAIGQYIAQDNPKSAYETLIRIKTAADTLQHNPRIGRAGRVEGTHELRVSSLPYILVYQVKEQDVEILAVMHTSRKWPQSL